ncbi:MAG TPA: hypothetical protein VF637_07930 [Sphingomicrobium sp.]|jgi:hypothetical protein
MSDTEKVTDQPVETAKVSGEDQRAAVTGSAQGGAGGAGDYPENTSADRGSSAPRD